MKNKIFLLGAMLLTLTMTSCHKDADVVVSYAAEDYLAFGEAEKSYAGKFRVFWKAMNTTYSLWDYEKECGLDWDEHYAKMLPKFEALDEPGVNVPDSVLEKLMKEMAAPLHDGHMAIQFKNHQTNKYVTVLPSTLRYSKRDHIDEAYGFKPYLATYASQFSEWKEVNTTIKGQFTYMTTTPGIGYQWAKDRYQTLRQKSNPTEADAKEIEGLKAFIEEMTKISKKGITDETLALYNELTVRYDYLDIPYLESIDPAFGNAGIDLKYFLTQDGIAYLYLSGFALSPYLRDEYFANTFTNPTAHTQALAARVKEVWQSWFNSIQTLHKAGTLKGVIIDVRSNPGGLTNDGKYVLGSLLPKGDLQYGWSRMKRGVGRYDYSPMLPMNMFTMEEDHEVVDDVPVAVLANSYSVSMSEMTSLSSKRMENARLIGRRTFGGLCSLTSNADFESNYTGHIGVKGKTPVYVYLPAIAIFDMDKHALEGIGVEPDIEVGLDTEMFALKGIDAQLERALEYVRTGK